METKGDDIQAEFSPLSEIGAASFLIPVRTDQAELLDEDAGTIADARSNLNEMWRINRCFGGIYALTSHLYPLLHQANQPLRVADIGTGSGEMGLLLAHWAAQNNLNISLFGLDRSQRNLFLSCEDVKSTVHLVQANACELPFAPNQIDYFISSLFLHHLTPEQVINLLRESYKRCRRGIVMSDLVRGYLPLFAFLFIQPLFARHYLTRHDGVLSIKRSYTPEELHTLARAAGIETARVYAHFPWRMTLVAEKPRV